MTTGLSKMLYQHILLLETTASPATQTKPVLHQQSKRQITTLTSLKAKLFHWVIISTK